MDKLAGRITNAAITVAFIAPPFLKYISSTETGEETFEAISLIIWQSHSASLSSGYRFTSSRASLRMTCKLYYDPPAE